MNITDVDGLWRLTTGQIENRKTGEVRKLDHTPSAGRIAFMPYDIFQRKCHAAFVTGIWPNHIGVLDESPTNRKGHHEPRTRRPGQPRTGLLARPTAGRAAGRILLGGGAMTSCPHCGYEPDPNWQYLAVAAIVGPRSHCARCGQVYQDCVSLADHCELWAAEQGRNRPPKGSPEWEALYAEWAAMAFADVGGTGL